MPTRLTMLAGSALLLAQLQVPSVLPPTATTRLVESLTVARSHDRHVWRDMPPRNADGTVNAYVEITRGERRKWEFDMAANALRLDRTLPAAVGGFPVNYGYVPQTISFDGDPFDALVLGASVDRGQLVTGVVVGIMFMEDEKGHDSKVVLVPPSAGQAAAEIPAAARREITQFFNRYKVGVPGAFSRVIGWGSASEAFGFIRLTHAFFRRCANTPGQDCRVR